MVGFRLHLAQDAALGELRLADVPQVAVVKPDQRIDPLIHYAGRVNVRFVTDSLPPESRSSRREEVHSVSGEGNQGLLTSAATRITDLAPFVNHAKKTVTSSTGEL